MAATPPPVRIGIYGPEHTRSGDARGCGLWAPGYAAAVTHAGAAPVPLGNCGPGAGRGWEELLRDLHGVVLTGCDTDTIRQVAEGERLCQWCREHELPLLGVDHGLHILNLAGGGTLYLDLPRELPDALQHRHPPEKGLRHAINVLPGTRLARFYGEGEIVVNSEHRRGVNRVARGFQVCARALDGIVEAIETTSDGWFAMGVQWHPASGTASGLDIQLFRGLVDMCRQRMQAPVAAAA
jgi:gamma-glutamyl-gamma-aminobutyrate hydrolase PuuD